MMEQPSKVIIRKAGTGADHAFVYATWRNALWYAERRQAKNESSDFYKQASKMIADLIDQPNTEVKVACLGDDPDMFLGWSLMRGDHLEFIYVKIDYRRKGIGGLLAKGFKTFSEPKTKIGKALAEKFLKEKTDETSTI